MTRTWKEILHSGDLTDDLLVAELESAIQHAEDEHYVEGFGEGEAHGLEFASRFYLDTASAFEQDRHLWLNQLREKYGD